MTDTTISTAVSEAVGAEFKALAASRGATPSTLLRQLVSDALASAAGYGPVEQATRLAVDEASLPATEAARAAVAFSLARRLDQGAPSAAQTAQTLTSLLDGLRAFHPYDDIATAAAVPDEPLDPSSL